MRSPSSDENVFSYFKTENNVNSLFTQNLHRGSLTVTASSLWLPFSCFECKSCNLSSTPLSLNAELIPPVYPCPLFSCIPTLHVFIKLNKMHVCFTCRPLNKGIGSFIRTQSVRFSPAKLSGRTAFHRRSRSFRLSQLCSSHWHPTNSFSLNQGIKPGTTAIVLLYLVARTVK